MMGALKEELLFHDRVNVVSVCSIGWLNTGFVGTPENLEEF